MNNFSVTSFSARDNGFSCAFASSIATRARALRPLRLRALSLGSCKLDNICLRARFLVLFCFLCRQLTEDSIEK